MKKPTDKNPTAKTKTTRNERHASDGNKAVTIDLKAEKIDVKSDPVAAESKPTEPSQPSSKVDAKKTTASKGSSSAAVARGAKADANEEKAASAPSKKPAGGAEPRFGRAAKSKVEASASPDSKEPAPSTKELSGPPRGWISRASSALVGGVVALALAGLLQYLGILGSPANDADYVSRQLMQSETEQLSAQIQKIQSELQQSAADLAAQSLEQDAADERIEQQLAAISDRGGDVGNLIEQIGRTSSALDDVRAEQQAAAQSIDALESAIKSGAAGGSAAAQALSLEFDGLAARLEQSNATIDQLKSGLETLSAQTGVESSELISVLSGQMKLLETELRDLGEMADTVSTLRETVETNTRQLNDHRTMLEKLRADMERPKSTERMAAGAVAAAALKSDIDRGLPFRQSLETLQLFSESDEKLARLQPFAETGIPTQQQLAAEFGQVGDRIISALEPTDNSSLASRFSAAVKTFVKVKATQPLEGETPLALVSQIAGALESEELDRASKLWSDLPDQAKEVSADWHTRLQSRIAANELIAEAIRSYIKTSAPQ